MASFRLSRRAEADLMHIAAYTLRTWGEAQTSRYIDGLEACCQRVADHPDLGRACDHVRAGLRRMEYEKHVVFYRIKTKAILINRILHQRMLPARRDIKGFDD